MNLYNTISIRNKLRPVKVRVEKRHDNHHMKTKADSARGGGGKKKDEKFAQRVSKNQCPHVARAHVHNPTTDRGFNTMRRR